MSDHDLLSRLTRLASSRPELLPHLTLVLKAAAEEGNSAEARLVSSLEFLGKNGYWMPPHNIVVNFALMGVNLWTFTTFKSFWKSMGYRTDLNALVLRLNWAPVGDSVLGQKNMSGFASMNDAQVDHLLKTMKTIPSVEESVNKEFKLMEQHFGIEIPNAIQSAFAKKCLAIAKRRWGVNRMRMKDLVLPLDGSKPYEQS